MQGAWVGIAWYWWPDSEGYWGLGGTLRSGAKVGEAGVRDHLEIPTLLPEVALEERILAGVCLAHLIPHSHPIIIGSQNVWSGPSPPHQARLLHRCHGDGKQ